MAKPFELFKSTLRLRWLGWLRIPLLASVRPTVVELDDARCVVRVPLRRWTKNHFGSMYFGALAIGADCAGGLLAAEKIRRLGAGVNLIFKGFHADFRKRPDSDVYFVCEAGAAIAEQVRLAVETGERITEPVLVRADIRTAEGGWETVAEFTLELSLKKTGKAML